MKMTILRELWIWMKDAVWFLRISRPGVRVPSIAPRKTSTRCVLVFLFRCERGLEQQRRRPLPAAETGRSCWGRVLIFQSPVRGLRKNQQTQPVRRRAAPQAISPVGCCLARGSHPIGMSNVEAVRECREIERFHGFFVFSAWHAGSFAPRPKTAPFPEKQHNPREHFRTKTAVKRSRGLLFYSALLCRAGFEARRFYAFTSRFCSRRYASANIAASQSTQLKKNSAYWPASMSVLRLAFMPACIRA